MNHPKEYHGALRNRKCPRCGMKFAVCLTELVRKGMEIIPPEANPQECPECLEEQCAGNPEFTKILSEHRERMHAVAIQFHAAAG